MSLSVGIVGLPNVGKSTLFNALTKLQVEASNYPFCTIEPNKGVVKVPDERLDKLSQIVTPKQIIPTTIEFIDIAGLVKNSHQGEGLGNQFLAHIRECDVICLVLREFKDDNVSHTHGKINPQDDKQIIINELINADLQTIEKKLVKTTKEAKGRDKELLFEKELLEKIKAYLEKGTMVRELKLQEREREIISELFLITNKPIIYIINTNAEYSNDDQDKNTIILNVKQEEEISKLPEEEQDEYIKELKLDSSGLTKLIQASYQILNLITFFTVQNNILQAWTIKQNTKAPQAAGRIHTDFEQGFIRVEIINWEKLIETGSEQSAREKGLIRTEGKDYIVQDGDVCHFLFSK
ncbi:redox-regulated ATPase YchF [Patescibacteria group bacterium]